MNWDINFLFGILSVSASLAGGMNFGTLCCLQNQAINLDLAAKILIGDPNIDKTEAGKFKSKFRAEECISNAIVKR